MRVLIYGTGGVGGTLAGGLADAGNEVLLVARGAHGAAIAAHGLTLARPAGSVSYPLPVAAKAVDADTRGLDAVFLCVKSQDTAGALLDLALAGCTDIPVVCAQNGVTNERALQPRFERPYGMLVWLPAGHLEPGTVLQYAQGPAGRLMVGRFPRGRDPFSDELASALRDADFDANSVADIDAWKHGKLLFNLGNGIDAFCRPGGEHEALREALLSEAYAALEAAGIAFVARADLAATTQVVTLAEADGQRRQGGSTWQSAARDRPNEVDHINGYICDLGVRFGVATPCNRALLELARSRPAPRSVPIESLLLAAR